MRLDARVELERHAALPPLAPCSARFEVTSKDGAFDPKTFTHIDHGRCDEEGGCHRPESLLPGLKRISHGGVTGKIEFGNKGT